MSLSTSTLRALRRLTSPMAQQVRQYSAPGEGSIPPAKAKYVPSSGIYPQGFLASGTHVGVKPSNKSFDDLALIASDRPCSAAAVFTKNKFQAAPVTVSRENIKGRNGAGLRAVVVNSGCANAVTGIGGIEDAKEMGRVTDDCFEDQGKEPGGQSSTIVMSTGVIGQRYGMPKTGHHAGLTVKADYPSKRSSTKFQRHIAAWAHPTVTGCEPLAPSAQPTHSLSYCPANSHFHLPTQPIVLRA